MKTYLGDGCYVEHDGHSLVLTTENGIETTNRIVLEPEVYDSLLRFVAQLSNDGCDTREHAGTKQRLVHAEFHEAVVAKARRDAIEECAVAIEADKQRVFATGCPSLGELCIYDVCAITVRQVDPTPKPPTS